MPAAHPQREPPIASPGPAIIHFQQVPSPFWQLLFVGIGAIELARARRGWVPPWDSLFTLREEYMPGDLNFDPLGLRHSYDGGLEEARARELAYGRVGTIPPSSLVPLRLLW